MHRYINRLIQLCTALERGYQNGGVGELLSRDLARLSFGSVFNVNKVGILGCPNDGWQNSGQSSKRQLILSVSDKGSEIGTDLWIFGLARH